jgi:hypothetical protein
VRLVRTIQPSNEPKPEPTAQPTTPTIIPATPAALTFRQQVALAEAEKQRDAMRAALLEAMQVLAKVDPKGFDAWLRAQGAELNMKLKPEALALYKPPFKFDRGYIFDADSNIASDDGDMTGNLNVAARVRGWGRIQSKPEAADLQDAVGELIAQALTEFWERHQTENQKLRPVCAKL